MQEGSEKERRNVLIDGEGAPNGARHGRFRETVAGLMHHQTMTIIFLLSQISRSAMRHHSRAKTLPALALSTPGSIDL